MANVLKLAGERERERERERRERREDRAVIGLLSSRESKVASFSHRRFTVQRSVTASRIMPLNMSDSAERLAIISHGARPFLPAAKPRRSVGEEVVDKCWSHGNKDCCS